MRKPDISSSLFWLAFALFTGGTGLHLGIGDLHQPGPGFAPFAGAVVIAVSALITLVQATREKQDQKDEGAQKEKKDWKRVLYLLASCGVYGIVLERVGFILCTFFLMLFFYRMVAPSKWGRALLLSGIVAVAAHLLFNVGLGSDLPRGVLGF